MPTLTRMSAQTLGRDGWGWEVGNGVARGEKTAEQRCSQSGSFWRSCYQLGHQNKQITKRNQSLGQLHPFSQTQAVTNHSVDGTTARLHCVAYPEICVWVKQKYGLDIFGHCKSSFWAEFSALLTGMMKLWKGLYALHPTLEYSVTEKRTCYNENFNFYS